MAPAGFPTGRGEGRWRRRPAWGGPPRAAAATAAAAAAAVGVCSRPPPPTRQRRLGTAAVPAGRRLVATAAVAGAAGAAAARPRGGDGRVRGGGGVCGGDLGRHGRGAFAPVAVRARARGAVTARRGGGCRGGVPPPLTQPRAAGLDRRNDANKKKKTAALYPTAPPSWCPPWRRGAPEKPQGADAGGHAGGRGRRTVRGGRHCRPASRRGRFALGAHPTS